MDWRKLSSWMAMAVLALFYLGCGDGGTEPVDDTPDPPVPTSITVTPPTGNLEAIGDTIRFSAQVRDQFGRVMSGVSLVWASNAAAVATVSSSGVVRSVSVGAATISVSSGNASASASVSVTQLVASLAVDPDAVTLTAIGATAQLVAEAKDAMGHGVASATVLWSTTDPLVATVDQEGLVSAGAEGSAWVVADCETHRDSTEITVAQSVSSLTVTPDTVTLTAIGATAQLVAEAKDAMGHGVASAAFAWSSTNALVVAVDETGLATAVAEGQVWIVAESGTQRDSSQVAVAVPAADPHPVSLFPLDWRMPVGEELQFFPDFGTSGNVALVWLVDGVPGGNAEVGAIDGTGLYTAPGAVPAGGQVTIQVRLASDASASLESPVTVTGGGEDPRLNWQVWTPRAIPVATDDTVTYEVSFTGYPRFELERSGGERLDPIPYRSGIYRLRFSVSDLLSGYAQGDLHHFVGYLNCDVCTNGTRGNVFVNVRDATVPDVAVVALSGSVQAGPHVVNIRWDDLVQGGLVPMDILKTFYDHVPDHFDFVGVIEQKNSRFNRFYRGVRNDTEGIGAPIFDGGAQWGSPSRLQGIISYPISSYFDVAERAAVHEMGHRWMAYLDNPVFAGSGGHWPVSSMARGIMGYSGAGGQGSSFPYEVEQVAGNVYQLKCSDRAMEFNDLELYLMGLLPADSVQTHVIFQNQGIPFACGSQGPADPLTIPEIIAVNGARVPDYTVSNKGFRFGSIILSSEQLLSAEEMAFFDHMAARGEAQTELHFTSGFAAGTTKPLFVATGGRATLSTRIF